MNQYTVTEFTKYVKGLFDKAFPETVTITGEVSNLSKPSSGHIYFTIKDSSAQLRAAFFKRYAIGAGVFIPKNGDKVKVVGDITLYEADGAYQILVKRVFYDSEGDFWKKFEETKRKLEALGFFEESRKRLLPAYPKRVAVITSATGAAIKDFIVTARSEGGKFKIDLWNVPVQGADAAPKIMAAIKSAGSMDKIYDVLVVMRGGGSLDDLAVFNEESVAMALAACKMPTISAVGHERDITVIDFVSDKRAATPTAAAVILSAAYKVVANDVGNFETKLINIVVGKVGNLYQRIDFIELKIQNSSPRNIIENYKNRINLAEKSLVFHVKNRINYIKRVLDKAYNATLSYDPKRRIPELRYKTEAFRERLQKSMALKVRGYFSLVESASARLNLLNPENILERGYALVFKGGKAVTGISDIKKEDFIEIKLKDGYVSSFVDSIKPEGIDGKNTNNS